MYEHLRAENARKLARDYHMNNVSFELVEVLDSIYYASKNGETSLFINEDVKINEKDVKTLRLMGYNVAVTLLNEKDSNGDYKISTLFIAW